MNVKEQIINELKLKYDEMSMGELLNLLQDIAEKTIDTKDFNSYLERANEDQELCEDQDCVIINGEVFDWKELEPKKYEIVDTFLNYFTQNSLQKILNVL